MQPLKSGPRRQKWGKNGENGGGGNGPRIPNTLLLTRAANVIFARYARPTASHRGV